MFKEAGGGAAEIGSGVMVVRWRHDNINGMAES